MQEVLKKISENMNIGFLDNQQLSTWIAKLIQAPSTLLTTLELEPHTFQSLQRLAVMNLQIRRQLVFDHLSALGLLHRQISLFDAKLNRVGVMPCVYCGQRFKELQLVNYNFLRRNVEQMDILPFLRRILRLHGIANVKMIKDFNQYMQLAYLSAEACSSCLSNETHMPVKRMQTSFLSQAFQNVSNELQRVVAPIQPFTRMRRITTSYASDMTIKHRGLTISYFYDLYQATNSQTLRLLTSRIFFNQSSIFPHFVIKAEVKLIRRLFHHFWLQNARYRAFICELEDEEPQITEFYHSQLSDDNHYPSSADATSARIELSTLQSFSATSPLINLSENDDQLTIIDEDQWQNNSSSILKEPTTREIVKILYHVKNEDNEDIFGVKWSTNHTSTEYAQDVINLGGKRLLLQFSMDWNCQNPQHTFDNRYLKYLSTLRRGKYTENHCMDS